MTERPIIIEDHFSDWDKQIGRTVVRNAQTAQGFVVSTIAIRHAPSTANTDFETMVWDFLGYEQEQEGRPPQPVFDYDNENPQFGLNVRLMERNGATPASAREYHYEAVEKLSSILEAPIE